MAGAIRTTGENSVHLPGIAVDKAIRVTTSVEQAVDGADLIMLVVPTQFLRDVLATNKEPVSGPAVVCCKGIEVATGALPTQIVADAWPGAPLAVLSGPSFAIEVARQLPTAVTAAADNSELATAVASTLGDRSFRIYTSNDPTGVQLGSAVKNVLAIGSGIVTGKGLGDNARAALITRGLAEMSRLLSVCGARRETAMGLSVLGDLVLTATSAQSRNTSLGIALGQGQTLETILSRCRGVAEGVATAAMVVDLAASHGIDMPICSAVDAVLNRNANLDETIAALLARPVPAEVS